MGNFGTMCGSEVVRYIAQVSYGQVGFASDSAFNGWIAGTLIPQAEKFIEGYCNHAFGTPSYGTITLDGNGKSALFLPPKHCPWIGLGAGSINNVAIAASDVKVHDQYLDFYPNTWTMGNGNVVLYGSYGYSAFPKDVEYVCAQLCANVLLDMVRRKVAPDLFAGLMGGSKSGDLNTLFAMPDIFQDTLRKMLAPYRIVWVEVG